MNSKPLLHSETDSTGFTVWIACLLVPLALASVLTGCMSRPALARQTFALQAAPVRSYVAPRGEAVLSIRKVEVSPLFESRHFVYRVGAGQYQLDPYAGFLISPTRGVVIPVRSYLRDSGAFKNVVEPGSQLAADTFLEIYVSELCGDFRQSEQPAAVLSIHMLFFDGKERQPFLDKDYVSRVPLRHKTATALVDGWNQALHQTITQLISDLKSAQADRTGGQRK